MAILSTTSTPADPGAEVVPAVQRHLQQVVDDQAMTWSGVPHGTELVGELRHVLLAGGKMLRPRFCYWGHVAAGGDPDAAEVVTAAAALELLHTFAIVQDDVMDSSAVRRGEPTVHARHASRHTERGWRGERRRYAEGVAVLVADLAHTLADDLAASLPPSAREIWRRCSTDLVLGQYLDMRGAAAGERSPEYALAVASLKSARYTVLQPMLLGAALTPRAEAVAGMLHRYGEPLGLAFQLRDDLIGVFGDPSVTGKPAGDDLREGKPTLLLALARQRAGASDRRLLDRVGRTDITDAEVAAIAGLCVRTGARDEVSSRIRQAVTAAREALADDDLDPRALPALLALADAAAWRER